MRSLTDAGPTAQSERPSTLHAGSVFVPSQEANKVVGIVAVATDDLLRGGGDPPPEDVRSQEELQDGQALFGEWRFPGKDHHSAR